MDYLDWPEPRLVVSGPNIEGLTGNRPPKPRCLPQLPWSLDPVGNYARTMLFLTRALRSRRERGGDRRVARAPAFIAEVNRLLDPRRKGCDGWKKNQQSTSDSVTWRDGRSLCRGSSGRCIRATGLIP